MKNRIFVGGLPRDIDITTIKEFFEKWGQVDDVVLPVDHGTGSSKGYCFVVFSSEAEAVRAFEATGLQIPGWEHRKNLFVDWARPRPDRNE